MTATATTVPQDLGARSWSALLRMAAILAVLLVLVAGSFAVGRSTAGTSDELPAVAPISNPAPQVNADSCGRTANTPPC